MHCGHDGALLGTGRESLARAEGDVRDAELAQRRAEDVEWEGSASDSFRARTAVIAAELAAIAAGIAALGLVLSSIETQVRDCEANASARSDATPTIGPARLPITAPGAPLIPHESARPLLPYTTTPSPFTAAPGAQEVCR